LERFSNKSLFWHLRRVKKSVPVHFLKNMNFTGLFNELETKNKNKGSICVIIHDELMIVVISRI
jgi:hypothetical protein